MGIQANGVGKYLAHFAGPMPILAPLMIPIEIDQPPGAAALAYHSSFCQYVRRRAGHRVFLRLTFLFVPAVFMGLHVFVSLLQAYIFMLMTMMYVAGAVAHEH